MAGLTLQNKTVLVTPDLVKQTQAYQDASRIRQKMLSNWGNVKAIDNSVRVVLNIGPEAWKARTQANNINRKIVLEIVELLKATTFQKTDSNI